MKVEQKLRQGLARLSELIDPNHLKAVEHLQGEAWAYRAVERLPVVLLDLKPPRLDTLPLSRNAN